MISKALPPLSKTMKRDDPAIAEQVLFSKLGLEMMFDPLAEHMNDDTVVKANYLCPNYVYVKYEWIEKEREAERKAAGKEGPSQPTHYVIAGEKLHSMVEDEFRKQHVQYRLVQYELSDKSGNGPKTPLFIYYPDKEDTEKTRQIVNDLNMARTSNFRELSADALMKECRDAGRQIALHKNVPELEYEEMYKNGFSFNYHPIKNKDGSVTLAFADDPKTMRAEEDLYREAHYFLSGKTRELVNDLDREFINDTSRVMAHINNNMEKTVVVDTQHPNRYLIADGHDVKFFVRTPEEDLLEKQVIRDVDMTSKFENEVYSGLKGYGQFKMVKLEELDKELAEVKENRDAIDIRVKHIAYKHNVMDITKNFIELTSMARLQNDRSAIRDVISQSIREGNFANISRALDQDAVIGNAMGGPTEVTRTETKDIDLDEIRSHLSPDEIQLGQELYEQYFGEYGLPEDEKKHIETWIASNPHIQDLAAESPVFKDQITNDILNTVDACSNELGEQVEVLDERDFEEYVREVDSFHIDNNRDEISIEEVDIEK